jgi:hypothetical protein
MNTQHIGVYNFAKTFVVGDIHGDWLALIGALKRTGVVKLVKTDTKRLRAVWCVKNVHLVFIGDVLDAKRRSDGVPLQASEKKILKFLTDLKKSALEHESMVHIVTGNHELMNIAGDFRYVSEADLAESGGPVARRHLYKPGGEYALVLDELMKAVIRIGDWVFVHAGFPMSLCDHDINDSIHKANSALSDYLNARDDLPHHLDALFWSRHLAERDRCTTLHAIRERCGPIKIVHGHTPVRSISSSCDDAIWNVDTGMSRALWGKIQVLEISGKSRSRVIR